MSAAAPAELVTKMLACRFGSRGGDPIGRVYIGFRVSGFRV